MSQARKERAGFIKGTTCIMSMILSRWTRHGDGLLGCGTASTLQEVMVGMLTRGCGPVNFQLWISRAAIIIALAFIFAWCAILAASIRAVGLDPTTATARVVGTVLIALFSKGVIKGKR